MRLPSIIWWHFEINSGDDSAGIMPRGGEILFFAFCGLLILLIGCCKQDDACKLAQPSAMSQAPSTTTPHFYIASLITPLSPKAK